MPLASCPRTPSHPGHEAKQHGPTRPICACVSFGVKFGLRVTPSLASFHKWSPDCSNTSCAKCVLSPLTRPCSFVKHQSAAAVRAGSGCPARAIEPCLCPCECDRSSVTGPGSEADDEALSLPRLSFRRFHVVQAVPVPLSFYVNVRIGFSVSTEKGAGSFTGRHRNLKEIWPEKDTFPTQ